MKKAFLLMIIGLLAISAQADVTINEKNFPDSQFRSWLLDKSYGSDGVLTNAEIASVTTIDVGRLFMRKLSEGKGVVSLQGIEFFTELKTLECYSFMVTLSDDINPLDITFNYLRNLDVSKNTKLTYLDCRYNYISSLDLSKNTALTYLDCSHNYFKSLDLSKNTALTILNCTSNAIGSLDLSKNTALTKLYCTDNGLTSLNVSACTSLEIIWINQNKIKGAEMDAFVASLPINTSASEHKLYALNKEDDGNEMTSSQVAAAKKRGWTVYWYTEEGWEPYEGSVTDEIAIDETNFPDLDFRNYVADNFDTDKNGYLNKSEAEAVETIDLRGLSIGNNTGLKGLQYFTNVKTLDISGQWQFSVDLSALTKLESLIAYKNQFFNGIDLSNNVNLTDIDVSSCRLSGLNLSNNTKLTFLRASNNGIKVAQMGELISSLRMLPSSGNGGAMLANLYLDGNEVTQMQYAEAVAKGWGVYVDGYYDAGGLAIDEKSFPDENFRNYVAKYCDMGRDGYLSDEERNSVKVFDYLYEKDIVSLKGIEWFPNLERLDCVNNKIKTLELANNTKLNTISCYSNYISSANTDNMVSQLPVMAGGKLYFCDFVIAGDHNLITPDQVTAAKRKGWTVYARKAEGWVAFDGTIRGDVNGDNKVNVGDIMAVINVMVYDGDEPKADVNGDNTVNIGDIMAVINIMAENSKK